MAAKSEKSSEASVPSMHASLSDTQSTGLSETDLTLTTKDSDGVEVGKECELPPGTVIGRYLLLKQLGEGGMGVVFLAHDPELNRQVAVKLLRVRMAGAEPAAGQKGRSEQARIRLQREAQALAQVSHTNIVSVFDVGTTDDGDVFVAMEYIEGQPLGEFCAEKSWRDIVEVYRGAAAGIAACHRVGLVHRDFKPSNVIVDQSACAKVLDFGLARTVQRLSENTDTRPDVSATTVPVEHHVEHRASSRAPDGGPDSDKTLNLKGPNARSSSAEYASMGKDSARANNESALEKPGSTSRDLLLSPLTVGRQLLGTPAYMSPEQFVGGAVGEASDQFSFCVSLYNALYRQRPFPGNNTTEIALSVQSGKIREPPQRSDVPRWLWDVIARGMATDPEDRWDSMDALAQALANDPRRVLRRRVRALALATGFLLLSVVCLSLFFSQQSRIDCAVPDDFLEDIWDMQRRSELERTFSASGLSIATDTAGRVDTLLNEYAAGLISSYDRACRDTHERGRYSSEVLDLRMQCVDARRQSLGRLSSAMIHEADIDTITNAVGAAKDLPALGRCDDIVALEAEVPPPEDVGVAEEVARIRAQLGEAQAQYQLGHYRRAADLGRSLAERAEKADYEPVLAEALTFWARAQHRAGKHADSQKTAERAMQAAADADDAALFADLHIWYLQTASQWQESKGWSAHARAAVALAGMEPEQSGELIRAFAHVSYLAGHYRDAVARYRRAVVHLKQSHESKAAAVQGARKGLALALRDMGQFAESKQLLQTLLDDRARDFGGDHPLVSEAKHDLATVLSLMGKYEEAEVLHRSALAAKTRVLGPEHPEVALSRRNLAVVFNDQGRYADAEAELRKALTLQIAALGPEHPAVAATRDPLSGALYFQGRTDEAEAELRAAMTAKRAVLGHEHPLVNDSRNNLAMVYIDQERYEEAESEHRAVLEIRLRTLGPDHPLTATSRNNLALALDYQERYSQSEEHHRAALAARIRAYGRDHALVAQSRGNLAATLTDQGKFAEAETLHREGLDDRVKALGPEHPEVAFSYSNLAALLEKQERWDEAKDANSKALEISLGAFGPKHHDVAMSRYYLGRIFLREGQYQRAAKEFSQVLQSDLPPTHWRREATHELIAKLPKRFRPRGI